MRLAVSVADRESQLDKVDGQGRWKDLEEEEEDSEPSSDSSEEAEEKPDMAQANLKKEGKHAGGSQMRASGKKGESSKGLPQVAKGDELFETRKQAEQGSSTTRGTGLRDSRRFVLTRALTGAPRARTTAPHWMLSKAHQDLSYSLPSKRVAAAPRMAPQLAMAA